MNTVVKIGIKTVSVSTIGKIIKRYDLTFAPTKINYHKKRNIKHNFIYPGCLGINGFVERAMNLLKRIAGYRRINLNFFY